MASDLPAREDWSGIHIRFTKASFDFSGYALLECLGTDAILLRTPKRGGMMRVTLVTETYFPQVNGVSRTLGQLVRHLTEAGDSVQLVLPDYGRGATAEDATMHRVRSISPPFYRELRLPLPPFGAAPRHRPVPARFDPHRHGGHAWPERARSCASAQDPGGVELPHELRPVQRSLWGGVGAGYNLALHALVPQPDAGDLCAVAPDDRCTRSTGFRAAGSLAAGRGQPALPPRSSRPSGRAPGTGFSA